jgi:hypothetical protein
MNQSLIPRPLLLAAAVLLALLTMAGNCQPVDDDDDSSVPIEGRVSISGGGVYETIQEAIDAASPGATINVSEGLYEESLEITKALTLAGVGRDAGGQPRVVVTGDGDGTIVEIDLVDATLQVSGMGFIAPHEALGTARGFRITDSVDVLLHEVDLGWGISVDGQCDHGLAGIEVSRSNLRLSEAVISCVGFTSPNGGTGILAQTDSSLVITDTTIEYVGSFGIRVSDTALELSDSSIVNINRPAEAGQYEADGSGIYVEDGTDEVVADGLVIDNGVAVGIWVAMGPALTVSASQFTALNYGIAFVGGDAAASGSRTVIVTGSTFTDMRQEAVLAFASSTITGNTIENVGIEPVPFGFPVAGGIRVPAPGSIVDISGNSLTNVGVRGIGVYGTTADGAVIEANVIGNTINGVISGNGIDVQLVEDGTITDNIVAGVDHAGDPEAPGSIGNGFGIDCFNVDSCTLENNDVSDAEFANYVLFGSSFSSDGDISRGGMSRGWHIESSQGTVTDTTVEDVMGYGFLAFDSTIQGVGGSFTGARRGPYISDLDGLDDPKEPLLYSGGNALYISSLGAPTYISWEGGLFEDNIEGGIQIFDAQVELIGNTLRNNGFYIDPETDLSPDAALYVGGYDDLATSGPLIEGNVIDGGVGTWGVYLWDVAGLRFLDNEVCVGDLAGVYVRDAAGGEIRGNSIGASDNETMTACPDMDWSYALYVGNSDPETIDEGLTIEDNVIAAPLQQYGLYVSGLGPMDVTDNTITGGTNSAVYATMTMPGLWTSDSDEDGMAEYAGDCDDTDPDMGGAGAVEVEGDGKDNDCDGTTDDGLGTDDSDGDGFDIAAGDCDDTDPAVFPGATELVTNEQDDNCDGWADLDGELPAPTMTMRGNTISGAHNGIWLHGGVADLADPEEEGDPVNSLSDLTGVGFYLNTWQWYGTPALTPGTATIGAETVIDAIADRCVQVVGVGAALTLDGATLSGCGATAIEMTQEGLVSLQGATIDAPGGSGLYAYAGIVEAVGGTTISGAGGAGMQLDGNVVAALDGATITDSVGSGLTVNGGAVTLGAVTVANSGASGIALQAGAVSGGVGLSVTNSTLAGVSASAGVLDLVGSSIGLSGVNGLDLTGEVDATIDGVILQDSGLYGLYCDGGLADPSFSSVVLDLCTATVSTSTTADFELINGCEIDWSCTAL